MENEKEESSDRELKIWN